MKHKVDGAIIQSSKIAISAIKLLVFLMKRIVLARRESTITFVYFLSFLTFFEKADELFGCV